jgi:precorrin-2 dehydrogenase/sirohydrochlorin ferrochelatase
MKLYPAMLNVSGKQIYVIGGGNVAFRKIQDLFECGAVIKVISPEITDSINDLAGNNPGKIKIIKRAYEYGDLAGAHIVFSATNIESVNREVYREAIERNIFINAVDDPANCSFFVPSSFNRGDLIVSVSTSGVSPSMASRIRKDIEKTMPASIAGTLEVLKRVRLLLKEDAGFSHISQENRSMILKKITGSDEIISDLMRCMDDDSLKKKISEVAESVPG